MKQEKGITLIALVITIIVLLILAGVTIAMLSGNNSAPQKATEAAQKDAIAATKDEIAMNVQEALLNYYNNTYVVSGSTGATNANDVVGAVNSAISNTMNGITTRHTDLTAETKYDEATAGSADGKITLKTKSYTCEGTVDKTNGSISWGAIQ